MGHKLWVFEEIYKSLFAEISNHLKSRPRKILNFSHVWYLLNAALGILNSTLGILDENNAPVKIFYGN